MKRGFLKGLGLDDAVIAKIMAEQGKEIESRKAKPMEEAKPAKAARLPKPPVEADAEPAIEADLEADLESELEFAAKSPLRAKEAKAMEATETGAENQEIDWELKYQQDLGQLILDNALTLALVECGARNPRIVKGLLDLNQLCLVEDKLVGLEPQLAKLRLTDGYLFAGDQGVEDKGIVISSGLNHGNPVDNGGLQFQFMGVRKK